mmetsp:Transcript_60840/g.170097  ORF Transcript_60840/g.170097 Transcript_60840/m.170097 type:complete len:224 (-) Transcript_60840:1538-2209(-)
MFATSATARVSAATRTPCMHAKSSAGSVTKAGLLYTWPMALQAFHWHFGGGDRAPRASASAIHDSNGRWSSACANGEVQESDVPTAAGYCPAPRPPLALPFALPLPAPRPDADARCGPSCTRGSSGAGARPGGAASPRGAATPLEEMCCCSASPRRSTRPKTWPRARKADERTLSELSPLRRNALAAALRRTPKEAGFACHLTDAMPAAEAASQVPPVPSAPP